MLPTAEQLDALVSPAPLPEGLFPSVAADKALSWQARALHCVRSICIKEALHLSLVNHAKVPARQAVSAALAAFAMESEDNIREDLINAFLSDQFALHGIQLEPNGRFLASEDFTSAFGFKHVFQSSIAAHLGRFCQGRPATFTDQCVAREALPALLALAGEIVAWEE